MTLGDIRRDYAGEPLDEAHAHADPLMQFSTWFEQVRATEQDPTAMAPLRHRHSNPAPLRPTPAAR